MKIQAANRLPSRNHAFVLRPGHSLGDISDREEATEKRKRIVLENFREPAPGFCPGTGGKLAEDQEF